MKPESEQYRKILNLLRNSNPVLDSTDEIEREVIKGISKVSNHGFTMSGVLDFLFGWVYIAWVRRSLITASFALVLVFVYQQNVILKRIDLLSRQTIIADKENVFSTSDEVEKLLMVYRNTGKRYSLKTITISEKQMKNLLDSVNELRNKYKDLENLIEGDPELKKLIEKKLIESNRIKINL